MLSESDSAPLNKKPVRLLSSGFTVFGSHALPIYLHPEAPFWFVPSPEAHAMLLPLLESGAEGAAGVPGSEAGGASLLSGSEGGWPPGDALARAMMPPAFAPHPGRAHLALKELSEIWFHLTDQCNLGCSHCLFGCGPEAEQAPAMDRIDLEACAAEAYALGCRIFCFTGGEPFCYPGFTEVLGRLMARADARIAVITNGTLIPRYLDDLADLDRSRIHFQVSLDGPETVNDAVRGQGTYEKVAKALALLQKKKIPCSTVMAVHENNFHAMADFVSVSAALGVATVHFLWHFQRGSGSSVGIPPMEALVSCFREAADRARGLHVAIDNLEAMRAQVFTVPGTRFDLGNSGFESLAVGPEGVIYPTPVMVGQRGMEAGHLRQGLEKVWRASKLLTRLRSTSLLEIPDAAEDPWRFILGGGDLDHSILGADQPGALDRLEADPYLPLYREMAIMLIEEEAARLPVPARPGLILRMGDITTGCPTGVDVNFSHSNCLLSMGDEGTGSLVRRFYGERADKPDETILNPVRYPADQVDFIPEEGLVRQYGCGSPILDADLAAGEVLVDLGSGTGVECFMAARMVGPKGRAMGIDMTDEMLHLARRSQGPVAAALGYDNTTFIKGFLEELPLEENCADVVVSNCVINLCRNKRQVFAEILRILKPGGRLVISDVVCEDEPGQAIRGDHTLKGECIAGALAQDYLFCLLREVGFEGSAMKKRFPYRVVQGHPFYSLTFTAFKPMIVGEDRVEVIYGGPFKGIMLDDGTVLERGVRTRITLGAGLGRDKLAELGVYVVNASDGSIENADLGESCCCAAPAVTAVTDGAGGTCCTETPSVVEPCCAETPPTDDTCCAETPPTDDTCCAETPPTDDTCCAETPPTDDTCCAETPPTQRRGREDRPTVAPVVDSICQTHTLPSTEDKDELKPAEPVVVDSTCCEHSLPSPGAGRSAPVEGDSECCANTKPPEGDRCCEAPHVSGCLECGAPLLYLDLPKEMTCSRCGRTGPANAHCEAGHHVCDLCHKGDPMEVLRHVTLNSREKDMIRMMEEIRSHPAFSMHGPEHHALVPGVILSTYRNLGGPVDSAQIKAAIDRGALTPGGACGFMGSCGAATGVGIAFALLLKSNPLKAEARSLSQRITAQVLARIADLEAARCCRRESYVALKAAAELSRDHLPIALLAEGDATCSQAQNNEQCIGAECSLFPV